VLLAPALTGTNPMVGRAKPPRAFDDQAMFASYSPAADEVQWPAAAALDMVFGGTVETAANLLASHFGGNRSDDLSNASAVFEGKSP
jgi:hypothetical protein